MRDVLEDASAESAKAQLEHITWLVFDERQPPRPGGGDAPSRVVPHRTMRNPSPSVAIPQSSPAAIAPDTRAASVLQGYALCGLGSDLSRTPAQRQRCADLRRSFEKDLPLRPPTEQERRLANELEHQHVVQDAPVILPCMYGGIDVVCVAASVIGGFDFKMGSYADRRLERSRGDVPSGPQPGRR